MATRRGRYSLRGPAAQDDNPIHERFLDSPLLVTGIPLLRSDAGRPQTHAAIARFFTSRGRARLSHDDALIVQQILAAAVGVDRNHWAYRDGIVGPRTRALLRRAMAGEGENSLRELQRRLQAAGLYSGEIDGIPGPLTLGALTDAYARVPDERRRILEGRPPPAPNAVSAEEFERRVSRALQSDAGAEAAPDTILAGLSEAQRSELERRRTVAREEARLFNEEHGHVPFGPQARAEEARELQQRRLAEERRLAGERAALEEYGRQLDGEFDATLPTPPVRREVPLPERLGSAPDADVRARAWADLIGRLRRLGYPVGSEAEIQQSYLRSRQGQAGADISAAEMPAAFDNEFGRFVSDARTSMPIYGPDGQRLTPPPLPTSVVSAAPPEADREAVRARMRERMRLALARLRLGEAEAGLGARRPIVRISDDGLTATIGAATMPLATARQLAAADGFSGIVRRISALAPGGPPHRDTDIDAWAGGLTDYFGMGFGDNPDVFLDAARAFRERVLGQPPVNLLPPLSREQLIRHGLGPLLGVDPRSHALIHTTLQEAERARLSRLEREAEALAANMVAPPPGGEEIATLAPPPPGGRRVSSVPILPPAPPLGAGQTLALPVSGRAILHLAYGQETIHSSRAHRITSKGIGIQTPPGAIVTSPVDGVVVYAGEFRSYGNVVIISTGNGRHVVLSGLAHLVEGVSGPTQLGQRVLHGEPIGGMALLSPASTDGEGPVLTMEVRVNGEFVDPRRQGFSSPELLAFLDRPRSTIATVQGGRVTFNGVSVPVTSLTRGAFVTGGQGFTPILNEILRDVPSSVNTAEALAHVLTTAERDGQRLITLDAEARRHFIDVVQGRLTLRPDPSAAVTAAEWRQLARHGLNAALISSPRAFTAITTALAPTTPPRAPVSVARVAPVAPLHPPSRLGAPPPPAPPSGPGRPLNVPSFTARFPQNIAPMTTPGHSRQVELTLSRDFDPTRAATITIFFPGHGARIGPGGRHDITGTGANGQNVAGQFLDAG